jgi:imidazole glycerol-phosphate synthase subunit HisH
MTAARLGIVDYGMGNRRSIQKAFERVGAEAEVTDQPTRLRACDGLILPGVGAFGRAMAEIEGRNLGPVIRERISHGVPVLGLCLGMQLLFESSAESEGYDGLSVLEGRVEWVGAKGLKLPHIGWNEVRWDSTSQLTDGLPNPCAFYHVHSFAPVCKRPEQVLGRCDYGVEFASAVASEGVWGVQFHPEKSGHDGLVLLKNFARICSEARFGARTLKTA